MLLQISVDKNLECPKIAKVKTQYLNNLVENCNEQKAGGLDNYDNSKKLNVITDDIFVFF